jgi:hypothetical protein
MKMNIRFLSLLRSKLMIIWLIVVLAIARKVSDAWEINLEEQITFKLSFCRSDTSKAFDYDLYPESIAPLDRSLIDRLRSMHIDSMKYLPKLHDQALMKLSASTLEASVPGSVHTDLMSQGIINDNPYYRYEELNMSWIPRLCWVYESAAFALPKHEDASASMMLAFDHIDAPAIISLNDITLGIAQNAHRSHVFQLQDQWLSAANRNVLKLQFPSSLAYAQAKAELYPYEVPATMNYNVWAEPTSRNFVRKAGSDFGWDW